MWSSVSFDLDAGRVYAGTGNNYMPPATDTSDAIIALAMQDGAMQWKNQRLEEDIFSMAALSMGVSGPEFDFGANPIVFEAAVGRRRALRGRSGHRRHRVGTPASRTGRILTMLALP